MRFPTDYIGLTSHADIQFPIPKAHAFLTALVRPRSRV